MDVDVRKGCLGCVCVVGAEVISKIPDGICEDRMALMRRKVMGLEAALQEAVGALKNCREGRGGRKCRGTYTPASTFHVDRHLAGKGMLSNSRAEMILISGSPLCYN